MALTGTGKKEKKNEGVKSECLNGEDVEGSGRGLILRQYPRICLE
jgi:hypothetical protein